MPLTPRPARSRHLLPWLVGALPIVLGLLLLYWQAELALQHQARQTAERALAQFELMLDNVAQAADELLPLAGQPCSLVELTLRDQVTRRPFVRSTNLAFARNIYCSSLFGHVSETLNPADYVDGRLWLMDGNPVTPGQALLVYRQADGNQGALAALDGFHLANALRMLGPDSHLRLQVGPAWLSDDGKVHGGDAPTYPVVPTRIESSRYPISLVSGFDSGATWRWMTAQYPVLFGLLVFLGILAGAVCRWLMSRVRSPLAELQRALAAEEFVPYYQPLVHADSGLYAGVEVLMRWQHPQAGLVRPDLFIPIAEDSGLIVPMTQLLLRRAALELAPLASRMGQGFHVGFNLTAEHCRQPTLLNDCQAFLAAFAPGQVKLVLELTERTLVEPTPAILALFAQLRALGVMIAIDDFGTGHSSLSYLRQFQVDFLKIDQSFVAMIGKDALSLHILDSIIELSAKLDLQVVAEGVENEEQRTYLAQHQVDFLQGYLFARPMPLAELANCL
ncbi:MAG: EAL domain-containing protein [Pseudomonas sp.]|nr:EAL domain-containing protein [Pseudomonas sp.]